MLLSLAAPRVASPHPSAAHRIELLSEAIRARPDDAAGYMRRGEAYSNEGHLDLALADLKKAEALGDPVLVAYDLGVLHYRMGKLAEALRYFDAFLERLPGHPPALEYRARVRRDAGDRAGALADYKAYFAKNPRPNPGDYVSAARLLAGPRSEDVAAALAMLDEGMQRLGTIPQLQRRAIELERLRSNLPAAIARLESLEESLGRSPDFKVDMADLLVQAGRSSLPTQPEGALGHVRLTELEKDRLDEEPSQDRAWRGSIRRCRSGGGAHRDGRSHGHGCDTHRFGGRLDPAFPNADIHLETPPLRKVPPGKACQLAARHVELIDGSDYLGAAALYAEERSVPSSTENRRGPPQPTSVPRGHDRLRPEGAPAQRGSRRIGSVSRSVRSSRARSASPYFSRKSPST